MPGESKFYHPNFSSPHILPKICHNLLEPPLPQLSSASASKGTKCPPTLVILVLRLLTPNLVHIYYLVTSFTVLQPKSIIPLIIVKSIVLNWLSSNKQGFTRSLYIFYLFIDENNRVSFILVMS